MEEERPRVSVVVPTRNRSQLLKRCLAALDAQTLPLEVIVVEDSEARGPAWARNEGVRRAQSEVICFTDDDCAPAPGWAEALTAPILAGETQATAGRTLMDEGATAADRAWEAIIGYLQDQAAKPGTSSPGFAATANLACTRDLLQRLPFDESFPAAAGEDRDWSERAAHEGAAPLFVPGAVVLHRPGMGVRDFLRQQYRYGQGASRYRRSGQGRRPGSPGFYIGLMRTGFGSGLFSGLLVFAAQFATLAGAIRETVKMRLYDDLLRSRR